MEISRVALMRFADLLEEIDIKPRYVNQGLDFDRGLLVAAYQNVNNRTDDVVVESRNDGRIKITFFDYDEIVAEFESDRLKEVVDFFNNYIALH